jgi:hypothetical protein
VQLLSSASRNTSGQQVSLGGFSQITSAVFQLTVSVAAAAAGDTLDVYIQHSVDGGSTYDDFVHFTQVLGNGGAKKFLAFWSGMVVPETELGAPTDATLAVGVKQGQVGSTWKTKWVIAGSTPAFTFKVDADVRSSQ